MQEESDSEEEILVYAEFEDSVNIDNYRAIHILGEDGKNPIIQLDDTFFMGKYENTLGTYMFFETDSILGKDPLFDTYPDKCVKYVCQTRKLLTMDHAYVTPKEGKEANYQSQSKPQDEDVEPVTFANLEQATDAFKAYFITEPTTTTHKQNPGDTETRDGDSNEKQRHHRSKRKQTLEDVLLEVNRRHVKIDKREKKKNNTILYSVLEEFLKKMKSCDKLFNSLKPKLEYLGSYFDGLRVGHATEYDINIILSLPLNYDKIKLDGGGDIKGAYATLKMSSEFRRLFKTPATANIGFKDTELWCDPSHRLSVVKFKSWMQRVVDATLNTLPVENGTKVLRINKKSYQIAAKTSGPANTLTITESSENIIDVDLVPTLEFKLPQRPSNSGIDFTKVTQTGLKKYFVVPKPSTDDFSWRLAFPFQERYYVYNKHNMKSTIKILKLLLQGFNKLASYYIKTIFLWEAVENTDDFWKNNSLSFLVLYMMRKLKDCLERRVIKNFWCPEHNLIETIKAETCQNWSNRLTYIINVVEEKKKSDPHIILQYLTTHKNSQ